MTLPRHAELWLLPYLRERWRRRHLVAKAKRAWVAITDHYEPLGLGVSLETGLRRVARWKERWPRIAMDAPRDARGQTPIYTFFYPQEEYNREILNGISEMAHAGVGDVEIHLHHDKETRAHFISKVTEFCGRLTQDHGLLHQENGRTVFGFIHGNWTLDNSHPHGKDCGLAGEIGLLRDLGCYADFTMPSIPSPTQGRIVNQIYWCTNNPDYRPRSYDRGVEVQSRQGRQGDLLMITGPVGIRWGGRVMPRVESGEIAGYDMPTSSRVSLWFDVAPRIGDDIFIKLYTHGAIDKNLEPLLGDGLSNLYIWLAEEAAKRGIDIHWVSAWRMYNAIKAIACNGEAIECSATSNLERA